MRPENAIETIKEVDHRVRLIMEEVRPTDRVLDVGCVRHVAEKGLNEFSLFSMLQDIGAQPFITAALFIIATALVRLLTAAVVH